MPELRETRRKVQIAAGVLIVLDVIGIAVLFSPLVGSARSRDQELSQLGTEIQVKTRQVEPLRGLDKKIPAARQQIENFYDHRLTSEDSDISGELGKLAGESGVKINGIKYGQDSGERTSEQEERAEVVGLHRVIIEADLSGNYLQLVRFINSLERNQMFFIVDNVQLGGEENGIVKLGMRLETYRKIGLT